MSLKEQAEALGIKVDGRWGEARIQEEIDKVTAPSVEGGDAPEPQSERLEEVMQEAFTGGGKARFASGSIVDGAVAEYVQSRAKAQWDGQSISLPRHERIRRIKTALEGKGYNPDLVDFDGLQ